MSCEFIVPELSKTIKAHFEVLVADGLPLNEVKRLNLRPYVERFQRTIDGRRVSLYRWKPDLIETIKTSLKLIDSTPAESLSPNDGLETPHEEIQPSIQPQIKDQIQPIDSSFLNDSSTLFSTSTTDKNEENDIFNDICYGECSIPDITRRIKLISIYFKELSETGLKSSDLRKYDLYGMLINSMKAIKPSKPGTLILKPLAIRFIGKLIEKYCTKKNTLNEEFKFAMKVMNISCSNLFYELISRRNGFFSKAFQQMSVKLESFYKDIQTLKNEGKEGDLNLIEHVESLIDEFNKNNQCVIQTISKKFQTNQSETYINQLITNLDTLMKSIHDMDEQGKIPYININDTWNEIVEKLKTTERLVTDAGIVVNYLLKSYQYIDNYIEETQKPFSINLIHLTEIFMIISKYKTSNKMSSLNLETLSDEMKNINLSRVEYLTNLYLDKALSDKRT